MKKLLGKLIVIDGIDGSGKSTQTNILVKRLHSLGMPAQTMNFPQYENNFFGTMVRQYLDGKFGKSTEVNPYLASLLYAFDRWQSKDSISQWLKEKKMVILDRYYTSNLIHQGAKIPQAQINQYLNWLQEVEFTILKIPKPDLVLYLHVDSQIAYKLITQREKTLDGHDNLKHLALAEKRCLYFAQKLGWKTIECCHNKKLLTVQAISDMIWKTITQNSIF